jgi:DNA repair protein SbcC/Rad50
MKILCLRYKNIQSLKGEGEIRFADDPIARAGLFAITGATGAGKSTLLDIITLALYNNVPRMGKLSKTSVQQDGSIVTQNADDAYAQIDYEVNGTQFRSTWRIRKARTGNFQDYEMDLASLPNGTILNDKKSEVPDLNTKKIGLSYEQFIRSILLSQGEFAKFLKSDKTERATLLEDITGTHIYREIGKAIYEKCKVKLKEISEIVDRYKVIPSLNEEEVEQFEKIITENESKIKLYNIDINDKNNLKTELNQYNTKREQIHKIDLQKSKIEEEKKLIDDQVKKVRKHKQLETHLGNIKSWELLTRQAEAYQKDIDNKKLELEYQQKSYQAAIAAMSSFIGEQVDEHSFLPKMRDFQQKILKYDNQLDEVKKQGQEERNKYQIALSQPEMAIISNQLSTIQDRNVHLELLHRMTEQMSQNAKYDDMDSTTLEMKKEEINQREKVLGVLHEKLKQKSQIELKIKQQEQSIVEEQIAIPALENSIHELQILLVASKAKSEQLQQKKEEMIKVMELSDHRKNLVDGEPCPLCGALHHPYIDHSTLVENATLDIDLHQEKLTSKKYEAELGQNQVQLAAKKGIFENLSTLILQLKNEWSDVQTSLGDEKTTLDTIDQERNTCSEAISSIKVEEIRRVQLKNCKTLIPQVEKILELITQYQNIKIERERYYNGDDVNKDADIIQEKFHTHRESINGLQTVIKDNENKKISAQKQVQELVTKLFPSLQAAGYTSIESAIHDIMDDTEKQKIEKQILDIDDSLKQLDGQRLQLKNEIDDMIPLLEIGIDVASIAVEIDKLTQQRDQCITENGGINERLIQDQKNKAQIDLHKVQEKELQLAAQPWQLLNKILGDAQGDRYTKFAQNLSLGHLLRLANKRLQKLTDRYVLEITDIENDLRVIDHYQGSISRNVKTLSGGETFILSLALALSLSDMASNNVKLECLFIDEGFGTLDADTLDLALETIERLQSESNKLIGIISHIESVKERISTQVKVHKNAQGFAQIEVVSL